MPKRGDKEFVLDMLIACGRILKYTENLSYDDFCKNEMVLDAVVRNIEVLGEAAKNVSENVKNRYGDVEWREIARTRDKIIHFYFGVDVSIVWDIATKDIPVLKSKLEGLVKAEGWKAEGL